jgi:hypothetical protein
LEELPWLAGELWAQQCATLSNKGRHYPKGNPERTTSNMGKIIDEMIHGYAKGYILAQIVIGCLLVLFIIVLGTALLALILTSYYQGPVVGHP